jgi:hypothetical protein
MLVNCTLLSVVFVEESWCEGKIRLHRCKAFEGHLSGSLKKACNQTKGVRKNKGKGPPFSLQVVIIG